MKAASQDRYAARTIGCRKELTNHPRRVYYVIEAEAQQASRDEEQEANRNGWFARQ